MAKGGQFSRNLQIKHALFNLLYESLNFRIFISYSYKVKEITNLYGFTIFHKNEHAHIITLWATLHDTYRQTYRLRK